jgi:hypothetical protein
VSRLQQRYRITHPFHPRQGEELDLVRYRGSYGGEFVDGLDAAGELVTVPLGYTDALGAQDPYLAIAAGRAALRPDDLLRLGKLVAELLAELEER